jgi:hypothetical protein
MVRVNFYLFGAAFLAGHTRRVDRKGLLQATPYPISALPSCGYNIQCGVWRTRYSTTRNAMIPCLSLGIGSVDVK